MNTNNKGFSLVELIVVIAIMAILAAVAIPTFGGFIKKANIAADVDFFNNVEYAAKLALAANDNDDVDYIYVKLNSDKEPVEIQINGIVIVEGGAKSGQTWLTDAQLAFAKDVADTVDWDYTFKSVAAEVTCELGEDGKTINDEAEFVEVEEPEEEEEEEEEEPNPTPAEPTPEQ